MKIISFLVPAGLLVSLLGFVHGADAPAALPAEAPRSPFSLVEAMTGGVWSVTVPGQNGVAAQHLELRFIAAANKQGIVYQSWTVEGGKRQPYQNGIYAWNAAKGKIEFFCTDSRASLTEGSYTADGRVLTGDFTIYNPDGSADPVHTQVTHVGDDLVTEQVFLPQGDGWAKISDLRLERHR